MNAVPSLAIDYQIPAHRALPHVVKFSGGRSSALLLFALLENNLLDPARGDAIVFNNTSAEHYRTYNFVIRCKKETERISDVPFFLTEFQTYETPRNGYWRRARSWRLAHAHLWKRNRPSGLRYRGEIFEEAISFDTRLPNRFQRLCTDHLKVQVTKQFLSEWFSGQPATKRLGHYYDRSQLTDREIVRSYQGTSLSEAELLAYLRFLRSCPWVRPSQTFADYARAPRVAVPHLQARAQDGFAPMQGPDAVSYIALLGLRADEPARVSNILGRAQDNGELPYFPLFEANIHAETVQAFWQEQDWDLALDSRYSNCALCFMKGVRTLRTIAEDPQTAAQGPSQVDWWIDMERRYQRVVDEVKDGARTGQRTRFGFFGRNERFAYAHLQDLEAADMPADELPCFCTD